jgi:hypothetical protein
MDPDACLARMVEAMEDSDKEGAADAAEDLRDWIGRGGALPSSRHMLEYVFDAVADMLRK